MKNKIIFLFIFVLLLFACLHNVSAFFTKSHIAWVVDGFNEVNSPLTQRCRPYLANVMDGNTGADTGVIYYGSSDKQLLGSYIGTHTEGSGFTNCKLQASNDQEYCQCIGDALHIVEDSFAHLKGGLVETYLKKFFGSNYFGHMSVEKSFENKHMTYLTAQGDYAITSGQEDYYNGIVLDTFFTKQADGTLTPTNNLLLLTKMAGIDMTNSVKIFRSGYQGEGFYNTVYKDKVQLPFWMQGISYGVVIIGLILSLFILLVGSTRWKYITSGIFFLIFLLGIIILYSFNPNPFNIFGDKGLWGITHFPLPSWSIVTFIIEVPTMIPGWLAFLIFAGIGSIPLFLIKEKSYFKWIFFFVLLVSGIALWTIMGNGGYLAVQDSDVIYYHNAVQQATNDFLTTGVLNIQDASGLSYTDSQGVYTVGALTKAETGFKWVSYGLVLPFFAWLLLYLIFKSLGIKFRR